MALSPAELRDIADRFFAAMNARDYASAAELYAPGATYESPALPAEGRLSGRDAIIGYFKAALEGSDFQLTVSSHFHGVNMTVTLSSEKLSSETLSSENLSSEGGVTFVDVLRVNDDGQIVEHLEVTPEPLLRHSAPAGP